MEKEISKKHFNKNLLTILLAVPIVLGIILYVSYCAVTPNYQWVYDNKIVDVKESTENKYYTINDSHDCFSTSIQKSGEVYKTNSESKELFKVNLTKLNGFNSDYKKLIIDFSYTASIDSQKAVYTSSPKIDFVIDGNVVKTIAFSSENDTDYVASEMFVTDAKEMIVNIKSLGIANDSAIPYLSFKNLKIKVLGA